MAAPRNQGEVPSASLAQLEELIRLKKVLSKALPNPENETAGEPVAPDDKGEQIDLAMDALNTLERIEVTRVLLAKSRIGLAVGALRRHSNVQIRNKSSALVAKWKSSINTQTPKANHTRNNNPEATAGAATVASGTPAPALPAGGNSQPGEDSKRGVIAGGTPTRFPGPFTGDSTRDKARTFLWRALVDGLETAAAAAAAGSATATETGRVAASIEDALWERFVVDKQSTKDYNAQLKTLKWNLADPKNPDLNLKVLWGMYTAEQLASMTSADLASDEKKREREQQKQESLEACQSDWEVRRMMSSGEAAQGQFPCFKCRTNKTVYFQMQTRSSDEPMTTFVTCLECGNRWKF